MLGDNPTPEKGKGHSCAVSTVFTIRSMWFSKQDGGGGGGGERYLGNSDARKRARAQRSHKYLIYLVDYSLVGCIRSSNCIAGSRLRYVACGFSSKVAMAVAVASDFWHSPTRETGSEHDIQATAVPGVKTIRPH